MVVGGTELKFASYQMKAPNPIWIAFEDGSKRIRWNPTTTTEDVPTYFDTSSVIRLYNLSVATKIGLKQHVDVHEMCKEGDDDSTPMYALSRMLVKA